MAPKTQKEKEQEAAEGPAGVGAGVLSMLASVGGMIPSLRKGPQQSELKKIQQGGGAGAAMARQTASEAARRVVGASAAQPSSGRGGNLREGLRAADQIVQRGAQQAAITGAKESMFATQQLRSNELMRRRAAGLFGAGVGQGLAGIAGTLAAAKDQGPVQPGEGAEAGGGSLVRAIDEAIPPEKPPEAGPGSVFGTAGGRAPGDKPTLGAGTPLLEPEFMPEQGFQPGDAQLMRPGQMEPMDAARQLSATGIMEAQQAEILGGLAQVTEGKQYAEKLRRNVLDMGKQGSPTTPSDNPPSELDPTGLEQWIYQQAWNYDPRINQGISPDKAAELLISEGFVPDYAALGLQVSSGQ